MFIAPFAINYFVIKPKTRYGLYIMNIYRKMVCKKNLICVFGLWHNRNLQFPEVTCDESNRTNLKGLWNTEREDGSIGFN